MNQIRISLNEVSTTADTIRSINESLYDDLMQIRQQVTSLDSYWQSDTSDTVRSRFQQFSTRFDTQKEVINAYVKFLEFTVSSYDSLESTLNANASSFEV